MVDYEELAKRIESCEDINTAGVMKDILADTSDRQRWPGYTATTALLFDTLYALKWTFIHNAAGMQVSGVVSPKGNHYPPTKFPQFLASADAVLELIKDDLTFTELRQTFCQDVWEVDLRKVTLNDDPKRAANDVKDYYGRSNSLARAITAALVRSAQ